MRYAVLGLVSVCDSMRGAIGAPTAPSALRYVGRRRQGAVRLPFRGTLEREVPGAFPVSTVLTGTTGDAFGSIHGRVCIRHHDGGWRCQQRSDLYITAANGDSISGMSLAPVLSQMAWSRLWRTPPLPKGRAGLLTRPGA